jgi:hypothetical protein
MNYWPFEHDDVELNNKGDCIEHLAMLISFIPGVEHESDRLNLIGFHSEYFGE